MPEPLVTAPEIAEFLHRSEKTLANWRSLGLGPPYFKAEGGVLYSWAAVRAWLAEQAVTPGRTA